MARLLFFRTCIFPKKQKSFRTWRVKGPDPFVSFQLFTHFLLAMFDVSKLISTVNIWLPSTPLAHLFTKWVLFLQQSYRHIFIPSSRMWIEMEQHLNDALHTLHTYIYKKKNKKEGNKTKKNRSFFFLLANKRCFFFHVYMSSDARLCSFVASFFLRSCYVSVLFWRA